MKINPVGATTFPPASEGCRTWGIPVARTVG